jgi:hypothetical protein
MIDTTGGPRMTSCDPPRRERQTSGGSVFPDCLNGIRRARRLEAAVAAHEGGEPSSVHADDGHDQSRRGAHATLRRASSRALCRSRTSSSKATVATDSSAVTTASTPLASHRRSAARSRRLIRFRITARFARAINPTCSSPPGAGATDTMIPSRRARTCACITRSKSRLDASARGRITIAAGPTPTASPCLWPDGP